MIEREIQVPEERKLAAAVIYNRLEGRARRSASTRRSATRTRTTTSSCSRAGSTRTRPTTRASDPGCRRRRSATRASPRSRPPPTRPSPTPSSSSSSRAPAASTSSSRPRRSSTRPRPSTRPRCRPRAARRRTASEAPQMPRLAVLGQPVAHSRSPAMQNAALAELGLADDWSYEAIEVAPERFDELVRSLRERRLRGRQRDRSAQARRARARRPRLGCRARRSAPRTRSASTRPGSLRRTPTRVGLIEALPHSPRGLRALVLGAGGAARACAWALREAGAEVALWNRTPERGQALARSSESASSERPEAFDLLVNATTVGLAQASATHGGSEASRPKGATPECRCAE